MQKPFSIIEVLNTLKRKYPLFTSEADFQFALAWTIKELYPHVEVRLEWVPSDYDPNMHIDIVVFDDSKMIPIELKYKTRRTDKIVSGERYVLKNHGAQDLGRYDFLKDIARIEFLERHFPAFTEGYCIFLTNDPHYLTKPRAGAYYAPFSIAIGDIKTGSLRWLEGGSSSASRPGIDLLGSYPMEWETYARIDDTDTVFQLVVPIRR
ncbi:MAG TPA: hypothetical protein QF549_03695 [Candidatus Saccharimonadaceae bacterium]|nr:hypothetical protein [Candidatus Saccharimonadaceae bacterium]